MTIQQKIEKLFPSLVSSFKRCEKSLRVHCEINWVSMCIGDMTRCLHDFTLFLLQRMIGDEKVGRGITAVSFVQCCDASCLICESQVSDEVFLECLQVSWMLSLEFSKFLMFLEIHRSSSWSILQFRILCPLYKFFPTSSIFAKITKISAPSDKNKRCFQLFFLLFLIKAQISSKKVFLWFHCNSSSESVSMSSKTALKFIIQWTGLHLTQKEVWVVALRWNSDEMLRRKLRNEEMIAENSDEQMEILEAFDVKGIKF
jgi:hypothetical protein